VRELRVDLPDGVDERVGEALWRLADARRRTLDLIRHLGDDDVDATPAIGRNTIGTLLYHVAAIELDWLYTDILQTPFPEGSDDWFPVDVRTGDGDLSTMREPLAKHLERLQWVRGRLVAELTPMTAAALDDVHENDGARTTPAWVLHHLAQHEAEHRGQIELLLGR
jgi:uncharacterized damage-inducible protein DinB